MNHLPFSSFLKRRASEPQKQFTVINNGVDRATVLNSNGADITEHFNVRFEQGIVKIELKQNPSLEEWRKIIGKV